MVGNEGMAGMPFILGMGVSGIRALVQGGGEALRMAAAPFRVNSTVIERYRRRYIATCTHSWHKSRKPQRVTASTKRNRAWRVGS